LSDEFTSLLNGLLDVRIPQRLGNLNKFSEFSEHSLFLKHDYLPGTPMRSIPNDRRSPKAFSTERFSLPRH
jgi:hypothetical protein